MFELDLYSGIVISVDICIILIYWIPRSLNFFNEAAGAYKNIYISMDICLA